MRYKGQNKEDFETWLTDIIVLIPMKKVIDKLEGQTRGICVQSVLTKWYCGCLTVLLGMEMRSIGRRDKGWECIDTFGFEGGRSGGCKRSGTSTWAHYLFHGCETKQVFDYVSPENLSLEMKDMGIAPVLAGTTFREQTGGKYDICFQKNEGLWDTL